MVIAGSVQTGTNLAFTAVEWSGVDYEDVTYTWTQANLTTMNLTTHTQVNGATWGFALSAAIIDTGATLEPCVDFMGQVEITYRVRGKGWLKVILGCLAALPSLVLPRLCKAA
jgi:xanthine dehydrogenase molybdopterin-binding subunit B